MAGEDPLGYQPFVALPLDMQANSFGNRDGSATVDSPK